MRLLSAAVAVVLAGSAANAGFFSFASDSNGNGPSFQGREFGIRDGAPSDLDTSVNVIFRYDADEDGPAPSIDVPARFSMIGTLRDYGRLPFSTLSIHSYLMAGSYQFNSIATGELLLRVDFNRAVFTSVSNSADRWGMTANFSADERNDPTLTFTPGAALAAANLTQLENFDFTLTAIRVPPGNETPTVGALGAALQPWISEGSWSARAVPTPGALALGAMGLVTARRRRR